MELMVKSEGQPADKKCIKSEAAGIGRSFGNYYAVAKGRKPGIYDSWEEAYQQIDGFPNFAYRAYPDRALAAGYLRESGISDEKIRLFRKTFKQQPHFTPNPTAPFKEEFKRFESSQQWTNQDARKAKVDFIRDEIITYCLPDGIRISDEQNEEEDYADLDEEQCLEVYQAMCHKAGKAVHSTIDECLIELKKSPFVNLLDFVDAWRTSSKLRTFASWPAFVAYTCEGRRIDIQVAKDNEFLAPLLQDLQMGPLAVNPIAIRRAHMQR
jgi:viroplasmin and RNaseH domain-containing protein